MGRLTLNVLLSFAQFEREVTGERIRDKIAASKRKGMWMGGYPPLGYDTRERQLLVNENEVVTVRDVFQRYLRLGSVRLLQRELDRDGVRSKRRISTAGRASGGSSFSRGALYNLLSNPIYIGEIRHKGQSYSGQHPPIIEREVWERTAVQLRLRKGRLGVKASTSPSLFTGKLFDEQGEGLTPTHTKKGQRRYRYYVSRSLLKGAGAEGWRIAAAELERAVVLAVGQMLDDRRLLLEAAEQYELDASGIAELLRGAHERSQELQAATALSEQTAALLDRIDLRSESICITIRLPLPTSIHPDALILSCELPLQIRRRGAEKRLLIDGEAGLPRKVDRALLKAVARAHCWLADFISGQSSSMTAIAAREKVGKRYVSRLIRLGLLAPEIVDQIVEGKQRPELTAESLTRMAELPLSWSAQKREFGQSAPS